MRNMGFRLAAGSVKTARCRCARRRVVLTGSAASSTIVAEGMGVSDLNKGTFLSRRKGDIFNEGRQVEQALANLYLHYVLDLRVNRWRKREATGDVIIVRYADDAVLGFQQKQDAERFLEQLRERVRKFGLELHPEKTRLIEFGRYATERRNKRGERKPETFNFLGFTHTCGTSQPKGYFTVNRKTIGKRLAAKLKRYTDEAEAADARSHRGYGEVAPVGGEGVFPISCDSGNEAQLKAVRKDVL
jgi:Reverse transcriptase (RNA-dependent DNA polymerase)